MLPATVVYWLFSVVDAETSVAKSRTLQYPISFEWTRISRMVWIGDWRHVFEKFVLPFCTFDAVYGLGYNFFNNPSDTFNPGFTEVFGWWIHSWWDSVTMLQSRDGASCIRKEPVHVFLTSNKQCLTLRSITKTLPASINCDRFTEILYWSTKASSSSIDKQNARIHLRLHNPINETFQQSAVSLVFLSLSPRHQLCLMMWYISLETHLRHANCCCHYLRPFEALPAFTATSLLNH